MTEQSIAKLDLSKIIREHLENVKNYMTFQMDAYGRNASGRHVRGLKVTALPAYGLLSSEEPWNYPVSGTDILAPVMEVGRRGGKVPFNFQAILFQWVKDKGIQLEPKPYKRGGDHRWPTDGQERAQWDFAGAVAHKIMTSGTALYRSGVREDIYSSAINREVAAILNDSRMKLGEIIDNVNKEAL